MLAPEVAASFSREFHWKKGFHGLRVCGEISVYFAPNSSCVCSRTQIPSATESAYSHRRMSLNGGAGLRFLSVDFGYPQGRRTEGLERPQTATGFPSEMFCFSPDQRMLPGSDQREARRRFSLCGLRSAILAHTQNLAVAVSPGVITGVPRSLLINPVRTSDQAASARRLSLGPTI